MKVITWWLAAGFAMATLAGSAYWLAASYRTLFPTTSRLDVDAACDLRAGRCERQLPGGGMLAFSVVPRTLPLMEPLVLRVELRETEVEGIQVDFVGLNMAMGINRTRLEQRADELWEGAAILPVCSRQVMQWEASVWLENNGEILAVPHRFETFRD